MGTRSRADGHGRAERRKASLEAAEGRREGKQFIAAFLCSVGGMTAEARAALRREEMYLLGGVIKSGQLRGRESYVFGRWLRWLSTYGRKGSLSEGQRKWLLDRAKVIGVVPLVAVPEAPIPEPPPSQVQRRSILDIGPLPLFPPGRPSPR